MPSAWLGLTRIDIPYEWIPGEAHHIALVTGTGAVVDHTIEVAQLTPSLDGASLALLASVGTLLGIVPVAIGLLAWPAMRSISPAGMNFLLALTIGLLAFLLIDTIGEGTRSRRRDDRPIARTDLVLGDLRTDRHCVYWRLGADRAGRLKAW